jgi:hypothetical protein
MKKRLVIFLAVLRVNRSESGILSVIAPSRQNIKKIPPNSDASIALCFQTDIIAQLRTVVD